MGVEAGIALVGLGLGAMTGGQIFSAHAQSEAAKKARRETREAAAAAAAQQRRAELRADAGQAAEQKAADIDNAVEISNQRHRRGVAATYLNDQNETL